MDLAGQTTEITCGSSYVTDIWEMDSVSLTVLPHPHPPRPHHPVILANDFINPSLLKNAFSSAPFSPFYLPQCFPESSFFFYSLFLPLAHLCLGHSCTGNGANFSQGVLCSSSDLVSIMTMWLRILSVI